MFGQFSTCDLVEFQRLLWSGQQQQQQQQQQQPQYINNQQPTIITGIQQQPGSVIATNANSIVVQTSNNMPVQRQQNFLNQTSVSFTTQPTTRYIPNQPQSRAVNHSAPHGTILIQQQQPQTQTLFSQSQAFPLDLGKQAQEARIREMVPEFEEQYFIQTSPAKVPTGRGNQNQGAVHRPQPHVPTSQAISDHLSRSYPQQDLIRQKMEQESQNRSKHAKKSRHHELYQAAMVELEVDNHANDNDYEEEEEEEDDSEEEYEEYEPAGDAGPWKCGVCHKVYKRKANFLEHQRSHKQAGGSKIQCAMPQCTKVFANDKTYQRHLKSQHQNQQIPTSSPRKSKSRELQAAISSISGGGGGTQQQYYQPNMMFMFKCDFCPEQFAYSEQLKAHEQMHLAESTLRCVTCEQPFLREEEFNQHIKTHLTETIWKCAMCNTSYDEYKAYKAHLDSHLPVVYKDPPPKPPEPEKTEETKDENKNGLDDDIMMMEVFEDEGSPQPSTSAAARLKSPSRYNSEGLARTSPMKNFGANKAKYATGSNRKVTAKGASTRDIIVKPVARPKIVGKGFDGPIEGEDDDIVILAAPKTPHRPIPIRVPPIIRKMPVGAVDKRLLPIKQRSSAPITANRKQPTPSASKNKHKSSPPPPKQPQRQRGRGRPKSMPATTTKFLVIDEDMPYRFQCIICKTFFPTKPARQQHILSAHCSQKSIEIKLLKLEDDPELDLEVIEEEEPEAILPDLQPREIFD